MSRLVFRWVVMVMPLWHLGWATADDLTLAVPIGPVSLVAYVAEAEGYFNREGVSIQMRECSSGRACYQLLSEGRVDLAMAAELLVTLNSFKHPDLVIVATVSTSSHQIKLVARRSAGIATPGQLAGKRVGTVAGTSAQYFLDSWLVFHGMDPRQVVIVSLAPDQLVAALQHREVDAIAIWEPLASAAVAKLVDDGIVLPSPRLYTQHFSLVTARQLIASRDADLEKVLRALLRAQNFIVDEPGKAAKILRTRLSIEPALAEVSLKEHDFRIRLDQTLLTTMSSQARWAVREGYVQPGSNLNVPLNAIEPEILRRLIPDAVTLGP